MALPPEFASRETWAFLRFPAGTNTFAFATTDLVRNGVAHQGLLVNFPEPQDNSVDDFGIQQGGSFTVQIADETDDNDWMFLTEDGSFLLLEDGVSRLILEN